MLIDVNYGLTLNKGGTIQLYSQESCPGMFIIDAIKTPTNLSEYKRKYNYLIGFPNISFFKSRIDNITITSQKSL